MHNTTKNINIIERLPSIANILCIELIALHHTIHMLQEHFQMIQYTFSQIVKISYTLSD